VSVAWLTPRWSAPANVRAAFTLRSGGVSTAPYDSLNLGDHVGDDDAHVGANRARVAQALELPQQPVWLQQVHGTRVRDLDARHDSDPADAAMTRHAGRVCAILVADCLPVLLASRDGQQIGAAHAGWSGLAAGVLEAAVAALRSPPAELVVWLGPSIGHQSFEVGDEVRQVFIGARPSDAVAFTRNARDRWLCDLALLARLRLQSMGIADVTLDGSCTFRERGRFFSFRRDGQCGRMAALLWRMS